MATSNIEVAGQIANISDHQEITGDTNNIPTISKRELMGLDKALNYEIGIVSGNANKKLAEEIAKHLEIPMTAAVVSHFSDGETRIQIEDNVRGKDMFVVQPTSPPVNDHLMELLFIIDALKRASAKRITAVIPYFGYGRQDRKTQPRVPISARLVADMIQMAGAHRVLAFELHVGQIQGFFNIPVDHMFALPVFVSYLKECEFYKKSKMKGNIVVISPDSGGMERARLLAKGLDAALAIIDKRRPAPNVAEVMNIIGEVEGRHCVILDDMADTAGTLTKVAAALQRNGARSVRACCIHAVLSGPSVERICFSCIEELVVTNSITLPDEKENLIPCITILSVGSLMAEAIRRVHREESISALFGAQN